MRAGPVLLAALALAACTPQPGPAAAAVGAAIPVNPDPGVRTYLCEGGERIRAGYPDRETAVVDYRGHAYTLKSAISGSGARYVGFGLQWWTKGFAEARLSHLKGGETVASEPGVACRVEAASATN